MQVTENFIRYLHTDTIYKRGRMYYVEGRVNNLTHDAGSDTWRAQVTGSRTYNTRIVVHSSYVRNYCDCPAYEGNNKCKHTCATLFAVSVAQAGARHPDTPPRPVADAETDGPKYHPAENLMRFLGGIRTEAPEPSGSKGLLKVEFTLRTYMPGYYFRLKETFNIQMRVGEERLYVVKDIRDFLHAITHNNALMFGKNFTFDPELHHFSAEDQVVIDKLLEIRKTEIFYENSADYTPARKKGKEMLIPANMADDLIMKLQYVDCKFENEDFKYGQLKVDDGDLPFTFALDGGEDDHYLLKIADHSAGFHYDAYSWYVSDGTMYKLTEAQNRALQPFTEYLEEGMSPDIPISSEQIGDFISGTLPKLKAISNVRLSESIAENVADPELEPRVYVDGTDYSLEVRLEYHYDAVIINPFAGTVENHDSADKILIRDSEQEDRIMGILENSGLKVSDGRLYTNYDDELFEFLHETLPVLEGLAEIFIAPAVKSMILPDAPKGTVEVNAPGGNFLEVNFNLEGISADDITAVLEAVNEKRKYVRLPGGAFVSLEDESLEEVAEVHRSIKDKSTVDDDGMMTLPLYHGMFVENQMADLQFNTPEFGKNFRNFIEAVKRPEEQQLSVPSGLQADLRDYQETGFKWMKSLSRYGLGGILADDMGLGKTVQCITYILSEIDEDVGEDVPFLIVAPASLVYNWRNEFQKFAPGLNVAVAAGTKPERREVLEGPVPDVYITSYHTLRQDLEWYEGRMFHTLILDEAQAIKNYQTKISKAVRQIQAPKRFALSGTPVENSMDELWAVFQSVMPGFLFDQKTFRAQEPETIARLVKPFILRRLKEDVLTELPDRIESIHYSEMNKEQKKLYLAYLNRIQAEAAESLATEGLQKGRLKILAGLTRLRQLCCHPSLFVDDYAGDSGKLEALREIIENARENGQRMLIFSQFPSMLRIIREKLEAAGRSSYYLDGQTPGAERVRLVEAFNEGAEDIFLISLKAGGTGLNLTGADTVVLYDLWWNPAIEEQAIGRAHRMGQKNVVQVIRMIAQGTIEEKINEMQQEKKEMIDSIIQPGEAKLSSMSEEDIREILSI